MTMNKNKNKNNNIARSNATTQACAACKYQRRKCTPDCILAPYFPHHRQPQFLNAHKLFGVSNITKLIRNLDPPIKDEAMRTLIFQSDVRARDPIGGCYRIIRQLQRQIELHRAELDIVLHHLAICREAAEAAQNHPPNLSMPPDANRDSVALNNCEVINIADPFLNYNNDCQDQEYVLENDHAEVLVPLQDQNTAWAMQDSGLASLQVKQPSAVDESCDLDDGGEGHEFKFEFEDSDEQRLDPLRLSLL